MRARAALDWGSYRTAAAVPEHACPACMQALQAVLVKREQQYDTCPAGRLFYLALPPSVYPQVRLRFMVAL